MRREGSDEHYAGVGRGGHGQPVADGGEVWNRAPIPIRDRERKPSITQEPSDEKSTTYRITLPTLEAAKFDAALASHHEGQIAAWKRDRDAGMARCTMTSTAGTRRRWRASVERPPMPTIVDGFMGLVEAGWDSEVARRPHGAHTTVVMHFDVKDKIASLHLGPLLSDADRRYFTCDATCEAWFERDGQPIGVGADDSHDQSPVAPCAGASPPALCGAGVRVHPRFACPSHPALGGRRAHRVGQPGAAVSVSPPVAPSRGHHHHRARGST